MDGKEMRKSRNQEKEQKRLESVEKSISGIQ